MSAESPFIEQARRPRLSNVLVLAGLVNRRYHRPRALDMALALRSPYRRMRVFLSCWIRRRMTEGGEVKLDHGTRHAGDVVPSALTFSLTMPLIDKLRERIERACSRWKLVYSGGMTFSSLHLLYRTVYFSISGHPFSIALDTFL
jgi:hypothetical protein